MSKSNFSLKEVFEVESKHGAFYTGGDIQWSQCGEYLLCQKGGTVSVLSVDNGSVVSLGQVDASQEEDIINSFILTDDDINVITHHKSGLFKLWDWKDNKLLKLWKSIHKGPVTQLALTNANLLMASGGSDGTVRLWDLSNHACTHNLKGIQGVVSVLKFHPDPDRNILFGTGDDVKIHGWDIINGEEKITLSGHFSKITSLNFHKDGNYLVSSGRDKVLILWDISSGTTVRVLPVYEGIEGAFIIDTKTPLPTFSQLCKTSDIYVASAGEKGIIKIWEMRTGRLMYKQENSLVSMAKEEESLSITHLLYNKFCNNFAVISVDHNIIIHSLESFECKKQLVGYADEILDVVYLGANDTHIALATNSCDIKLYDIASMNCQLLCGHTGIVLALATTPANANLLISAAKDKSVRVWLMDKERTKMFCIGHAVRHTAAVGSVAISQESIKFFASVAQDTCLKLWKLSNNLEYSQELPLNVSYTVQAHEKDINCVTVSQNDKLIATASQDKTAKLWSAENLQKLGVFHGHRRGVWCARFSPFDQVLLTTSADCTMKLWSLTELNCLKTLEGHESSVLRGEFLSRGMQLITAGGDGLLKLWNIKTSECISTLDQHKSRVWTLAVTKDQKHIISGDNDSLLVIWKDVTEEKREQSAKEKEQRELDEQTLMNLLQSEELHGALLLALKLDKPYKIFKIVEALLKGGNDRLTGTIKSLNSEYKEKLFRCAMTWNTNSRNSHIAQVIINVFMMEIGAEQLWTSGFSSILEA
ncbi:transducin beta-like protein 3 isoform X2 [Harpegnathos saltator]|uniref:transducin beta-like protein 3 isoform X2 n=1 Tax=Harpegnathos saltator TaxID=610380 RepID=UPI000DBEE603|nr:transducin beta-like protein 3 isoform X2 [Harpegnathos saltator]